MIEAVSSPTRSYYHYHHHYYHHHYTMMTLLLCLSLTGDGMVRTSRKAVQIILEKEPTRCFGRSERGYQICGM